MTDNYREEKDQKVNIALADALRTLRVYKPQDHTERARRYAVTITEVEKALAYFRQWVIEGGPVLDDTP